MKKKYIAILIGFCLSVFNLKAQSFDWATGVSGSVYIEPHATTFDDRGNIYSVGIYSSGLIFPDTIIYPFPSTDNGMYIIKYDKHKNRKWFKIFPSYTFVYNSFTSSVKTDALGNVYVVTIPETALNDTLGRGVHLIKYNADGKLLWYHLIPGSVGSTCLTINRDNNINMVFNCTRTGNFGNIKLTIPTGETRLAYSKINSDGKVVSVKLFPEGINLKDIDFDDHGNFAAVTSSNIIAVDTSNWAIRRLNVKSGTVFITSVLLENSGDIIFAGTFRESVYFGTTTLTATLNDYRDDMFLACYDATGKEKWVKQIKRFNPFGEFCELWDIKSSKDGNVFVVGKLPEKTIFEKDTVRTKGSSDSFIAKYDAEGTYNWTKLMGNPKGGSDIACQFDINSDDVISIAGIFSNNYFAFGNDTLAMDYGGYTAYVTRFIANSNLVSGNVFMDTNKNGKRDSTESGLENTFVNSIPFNHYAYSNRDGNYLLPLDKGSFSIYPQLPRYHQSQPASRSLTFTGYGQKATLNDFAVSVIPNITDVKVDITNVTKIRFFSEVYYQLNYKNVGTDTVNGEVTLKKDSLLNFLSWTGNATLTGDTMKWSYSALKPNESRWLNVICELKGIVPLSEKITMNAFITPIVSDTLPSNNYDTLTESISNSFDPNDKSVTPEKDIPLTYIKNENFFEYVIRFQNTGNDTAFKIMIVDTISPSLDLTTLEIVSSSHSHEVEVAQNGRVEFIYNNILLPDSTTNEVMSHGFIKYRIKALQTVTINDTIKNTAHIYFDYNAPVTTNTTVSIIVSPIGVDTLDNVGTDVLIYPNPSSRLVNYIVNLKTPELVILQLYDITGKLISSNKINDVGKHIKGSLDVSQLQKGIYVFEFIGTNTRISRKLIIN